MRFGHLFDSATLKLTGWYLVLLAVLSLMFSGIVYSIASQEFSRTVARGGPDVRIFADDDRVDAIIQQRVSDSNARLIGSLAVFNTGVLLAGGVASYFLARRTLRPIEQAMEAQSRFSSDAAHELRTPLAIMQSEIEVGLRNTSATKSAYGKLLRSNLDEVHRLQQLTERLMVLASTQEILLGEVDVEEATIDAVNRIIPLAQAKSIKVNSAVPSLSVLADRDSLIDILTILLDNAIKYSPDNSTVDLSANVSGASVVLAVRDEGIGMSEGDRSKVFDRFYRADQSRTRNTVEGHGLGLSIAARLTRLLDGQLSVTSSLDKGSVFTLRLKKS